MTDHENDHQSVRWTAVQLLADLDGYGVVGEGDEGSPLFRSIERLRLAVERERTAELPIDNAPLVIDGIGLIKAGRSVSAEHIRAIVAAAELAAASHQSFNLRWEADMRAIERWQAADLLAPDVRQLLGEVEPMMREVDTQTADEIAALLARTKPGARDLIWPDHVDLVVWLVELLEHRPACPKIAEVEALIGVLGRAGIWHAGMGAMHGTTLDGAKAAEHLRQIANSLIAASRRVIVAESKVTGMRRLIPVDLTPVAKPPAGQDREALEAKVNRRIEEAWVVGGEETVRRDLPGILSEIAPGWTYQEVTGVGSGARLRIVLTKYEPDAPL